MKLIRKVPWIKWMALPPMAIFLSGCNFDWFFEFEPPTDPDYYSTLENSRPDLTSMEQYEALDDLSYLANSVVIYFADPVFDLTGSDNSIVVNTDTGEFTVQQTFSVDSSTGTLVDSGGFYNYTEAMVCTIGITMKGDWNESNKTLTGITGEISTVSCTGGAGGPERNTNYNGGNEVVFLDSELDLNSNGSGGYVDGVISYKYGLLDLPWDDPIGPIAFEFEATTTLVPK